MIGFKSRKKLKVSILVGVVLVIAIGIVFFLKSQTVNAEIGNLQVFKGSAQIVNDGKSTTGSTGSPVSVSDHIVVPEGSIVALVLKDNTIIRLEGGSDAEVGELSYENGKIKDAVLKLSHGRAWSRVQTVQKDSKFEVETPTVTASVRGTSFNATFKDEITGIYVYHHIVGVTLTSSGAKQDVPESKLLQMHQGSLPEDFAKGSDTPPDEFFDDWIKFNQQQDDMLCEQLHDLPECFESKPEPKKETKKPEKKETDTATTPNYYSTPIPTPKPVTLTKVIVSCAYTDFEYSPTPPSHSNPVPCTATAKYSDGKTKDVTQSASWGASPNVGQFYYSGGYEYYLASFVASSDNLVIVKAAYGGKIGSIAIDTQALG